MVESANGAIRTPSFKQSDKLRGSLGQTLACNRSALVSSPGEETEECRMRNHVCGIVEVADLEEPVAYTCNSDAVAICFDCCTHLCDAHAGHCDLCNEVFCATCLAFHNREQHLKKPARVPVRQRRKSA